MRKRRFQWRNTARCDTEERSVPSSNIQAPQMIFPALWNCERAGVACGRRFQLLDRSSESFGRFADYESPGCKADMAEGSAEEEQSSTAAPASPPADLRTLNTQLSPPYHHQSHLVPPLQHLQHPNMLATAVPPRHSHSMLSHQGKTDAELDAPCDVPLNLKSEVSLVNLCLSLSILSLSISLCLSPSFYELMYRDRLRLVLISAGAAASCSRVSRCSLNSGESARGFPRGTRSTSGYTGERNFRGTAWRSRAD